MQSEIVLKCINAISQVLNDDTVMVSFLASDNQADDVLNGKLTFRIAPNMLSERSNRHERRGISAKTQ